MKEEEIHVGRKRGREDKREGGKKERKGGGEGRKNEREHERGRG